MRTRLLAVAVLVLIVGCDGPVPTEPSVTYPGAARSASPFDRTAGRSAGYLCTMVDYTGERVRTKEIALDLHPTGSTMPYVVVWVSPGGQTLRRVSCDIPRSMAAIRAANEHFNVPEQGYIWTGSSHRTGDISIQGCVEDGACTLDPVVVTAEPDPYDGYDGYEQGDYCQTSIGVVAGLSLDCST
jgi:hypothetical protein